MKIFRRGINAMLVLAVMLALPTFLSAPARAAWWKVAGTSVHAPEQSVTLAQYNGQPLPRLIRPRRPLPPRLRGLRPPAPSPRRPGGATRSEVRIQPSEALRLAQRRWPRSIGLSVRLLKRAKPVYAVKLRAGNRVVLVLVDARTGRVLQ